MNFPQFYFRLTHTKNWNTLFFLTPFITLLLFATFIQSPRSKGLTHLALFYTLGGRLIPHPFTTWDEAYEQGNTLI